jgi:hypothetical protein
MDGPWWASSPPPVEPSCPHYWFFRGAVQFGDKRRPTPPKKPGGPARPGPEVPYVIPRQLELPGMIAVVGELPMEPGWRAFPIVYFADPRPPAEELTSDWCSRTYPHVNSITRQQETSYPNDTWDFDLEPWIAQGKLRWCSPGSGNLRLAPPGQPCPYVGLPGIREDITIDSTFGFKKRGVPDGSIILPFE